LALDDDIRILSGVAFFDGFTTEQLRLLAFGGERLALAAGEELYRQGAAADSGFVLLSGAIELYAEDDGTETPAGRARPGALLGELALIVGARRPTSARAAAESHLLRLARRDFRRVLEEYPDLAIALHKRVAGEFQAMIESIERLAPRFSQEP
jgi:CRP-like cAMP-binding protein